MTDDNDKYRFFPSPFMTNRLVGFQTWKAELFAAQEAQRVRWHPGKGLYIDACHELVNRGETMHLNVEKTANGHTWGNRAQEIQHDRTSSKNTNFQSYPVSPSRAMELGTKLHQEMENRLKQERGQPEVEYDEDD